MQFKHKKFRSKIFFLRSSITPLICQACLVIIFMTPLELHAQEWEHVAKNPNVNLYFKVNGGEKIGKIVRLWTLVDYSKPELIESGNKKYYASSIISFEEFDCKKLMNRAITRRTYSERMGKGDVLLIEDGFEWVDIEKNTIIDGMKNEACR
jgi:hypothetical protein